MSEIVSDSIKIFVRYRSFDDDGVKWDEKFLAARQDDNDKWHYSLRSDWKFALDWVQRYDGDRLKAMDMARKLAQIVKRGKRLLEMGYVYDLYMVRDVIHRTEVSLTDHPMVAIAVAALDDGE